MKYSTGIWSGNSNKSMATKASAIVVAMLLLVANPARAGFSVDVYVDNVFFTTILDGGLGDDNGTAGDISYSFDLMDVQNRWRATGLVLANGGYNGVPPVSTIVTDVKIEKIANVPIFAGEIDFRHHYASSGLQAHTAAIDGVFNNTLGTDVGGASLEYYADVNGQSLGGYATGLYSGPEGETFNGSLGPLLTPTTTEHHMKLRFYLDTLGDAIEMFNSAEIHTVVPEPTVLGLLLPSLGILLVAGRGSKQTGATNLLPHCKDAKEMRSLTQRATPCR